MGCLDISLLYVRTVERPDPWKILPDMSLGVLGKRLLCFAVDWNCTLVMGTKQLGIGEWSIFS